MLLVDIFSHVQSDEHLKIKLYGGGGWGVGGSGKHVGVRKTQIIVINLDVIKMYRKRLKSLEVIKVFEKL